MKNDIIEKIHSVGKVSRIVSRIAQVVALIGIVACMVAGVIGLFIPKDAMHFNGTASGKLSLDTKITEFETSIKNGKVNILGAEFDVKHTETTKGNIQNVDIEVKADDVDGNVLKMMVFSAGLIGTVFCALLWLVMRFTVKLSKTLETCSSPFEENVLAAMKKLSISLIPFGIFVFGISGISAVALILMILVVMLFINIFRYGAKLQQESDDTV